MAILGILFNFVRLKWIFTTERESFPSIFSVFYNILF